MSAAQRRQELFRQRIDGGGGPQGQAKNLGREGEAEFAFSRRQDDPELYHGVSADNLRFIHEDDEHILVQQQQQQNEDGQQEQEQQHDLNHLQDDPFAEFNAAAMAHLAANGPHLAGDKSASPSDVLQEVKRVRDSRVDTFLQFQGEQSRKNLARQQRDAEQGPHRNEGGIQSGKSASALAAERRLLQVLDSNAEDATKADSAVSLSAELKRERLPVRARVVEEVFSLWARLSSDDFESAAQQQHIDAGGDAGQQQLPRRETSSYLAISYLEPMSSLYFHLRQTHTAPTPQLVEHFMVVLSLCASVEELQQRETRRAEEEEGGGDRPISSSNNSKQLTSPFHTKVMSIAHRVVLDTDRFAVMPTRQTLSAYFDICGLSANMDIALVRFADAKQRLFLEPDTHMVRAIVAGLCRNGLVSESLAFLARVSAVQVDVAFLNSILGLLVLSDEPMAAFAAFRCMEESGVVPNSGSFHHLLRACEASGHWGAGVPFVLAEMQRLRVRGDDATLGLLLKGLLVAHGMRGYAQQLYLAMKQKGVPVFAEAEKAMPLEVQNRGRKLLAAAKRISAATANNVDDDADERRFLLQGRTKRRAGAGGDADEEERLKFLASKGAFLPAGGNNNGRRPRRDIPPTPALCAFALRKNLGSVTQQEKMEQLRDLKRELKRAETAAGGNRQREEQSAAAADEPSSSFEDIRERLISQSRSLRPMVFRLLHKHFFGVSPVSTRVVDPGKKKHRKHHSERL